MPRIVVVGVGGGGGNAVNNMISRELQGVEFLVCNTDAQHLSTCRTPNRVQLGRSSGEGLGCGANPDAGRVAALESRDEVLEYISGAHMVFITAGMGGGTGTGAAPVIAEACKQEGVLTVAVVTKPFRFEGTHRMRLADEGLSYMRQATDSLIVIPNQNLFKLVEPGTSLVEAFALADDVLLSGVRSISDLMLTPGLINLDFADVQAVMADMGSAMMGTGEAEGENRAVLAAEGALRNPLLGDLSVRSAKGLLVNIAGGSDLTLFEADAAATRITDEVENENANIIFGSAHVPSLEGRIRVSVVATGLEDLVAESPAAAQH
ncbi:Tubulin/FtsZ, GTPase domain-containing protein [Tribonema minus]|uniref:Tubulin/FtsZ, GTPase domain-containing protein n=1 Tax=Tribonema minus TaxID=303371 RepID=A0A835Z440_9STRA|nr:Tubulin/FtsZ, GTPase domain-containing protein [Tribonema minus]